MALERPRILLWAFVAVVCLKLRGDTFVAPAPLQTPAPGGFFAPAQAQSNSRLVSGETLCVLGAFAALSVGLLRLRAPAVARGAFKYNLKKKPLSEDLKTYKPQHRDESPVNPDDNPNTPEWAKSAAIEPIHSSYDRSETTNPLSFQRGSPHVVPVLDMDGNQISEEVLHLRTFSKMSANYAVWQAINIWRYQQRAFGAYMPRRHEIKAGCKPFRQKGGGRARQSSKMTKRYKTWIGGTSKPHGLDDKRRKVLDRLHHHGAIATVLHTKWRGVKIVDGLENWNEPSQLKLMDHMRKWLKIPVNFEGPKNRTLIITRCGYGEIGFHKRTPLEECNLRPLYMSGWCLPRTAMRSASQIDPDHDGLYHLLIARRVIMSREAFFDIMAKYGSSESEQGKGWAFANHKGELLKNLTELAAQFPCDQKQEIELARTIPQVHDARMEWARRLREADPSLTDEVHWTQVVKPNRLDELVAAGLIKPE